MDATTIAHGFEAVLTATVHEPSVIELHQALWTKDKHSGTNYITLETKHSGICFSALSGRLLPLLSCSCLKEQVLFMP